ncbi:hypothetical protein OsJ_24031 [Oryza sativa Japonica Group]|uniref:Neprosin activation peptide domain-containing protein n=1 Tax=Oryza sativa subsp. japonica TaxID=39947 RepID=B9FWY0_ORYSJ|nr:hypothetical protein OsJ_24031 [Oryza sativa Japonica Group]
MVRISAPSPVTKMVCSNCAVRLLSTVTAVHPSSHSVHWVPPMDRVGSALHAAQPLTKTQDHVCRRVPLTFLLGEEKAALVQARFERTIRHAQVEVCTALEVVKEASSGRHVEQGAIPGGRLDTAGQRQGHQPRAEGWVVFKKATVNISVVYGVTPPTRTVRETQCHGCVRVQVEPEPEERPKVGGAAAAHGEAAEEEVVFPMAWTNDDESCPEGTVPVRQTTKRDVLRSSSSLSVSG